MREAPRGNTPIDLIVLHDPEGADTARDLYGFLQTIDGGYHSLVDDNEEIVAAPDNIIVDGAGGVNERALHICFVPGRAAWSRQQWLPDTPAIVRGARRAMWWGLVHGIPMRHLTPAQVATVGVKGICTHGDVTAAGYTASEGHTDPGPNFPMDVFLAACNPAPLPEVPVKFLHSPDPHNGGWFCGYPNGRVTFLTVGGAELEVGMDVTAHDRAAWGNRELDKLVPRRRDNGMPGFTIVATDGHTYVPQGMA